MRVFKDVTYVFPRNPGGGVILGGCRIDDDWNGEVDLVFAEDIKRRCVKLAPELGRVEDLRVLSHGVGLRREFFLLGFGLRAFERKIARQLSAAMTWFLLTENSQ